SRPDNVRARITGVIMNHCGSARIDSNQIGLQPDRSQEITALLAHFKNMVHNLASSLDKQHGGIAQLGERLHGMQEVSGSIPLTSTSQMKKAVKAAAYACFICYNAQLALSGPLRLEA